MVHWPSINTNKTKQFFSPMGYPINEIHDNLPHTPYNGQMTVNLPNELRIGRAESWKGLKNLFTTQVFALRFDLRSDRVKDSDFCKLLRTKSSSNQLLSKKYWCVIYSFIYTFIVLGDYRDVPQPWTLYCRYTYYQFLTAKA